MKTNALQLDKKRTFTDRRLIRVSTACGIIATAACVIVFAAHGADSRAAAVSFSILIYPVAALIISGLWLASAELLRNRYPSAVIAFCLHIAAVILYIAYIVMQAVTDGGVLVFPFFL